MWLERSRHKFSVGVAISSCSVWVVVEASGFRRDAWIGVVDANLHNPFVTPGEYTLKKPWHGQSKAFCSIAGYDLPWIVREFMLQDRTTRMVCCVRMMKSWLRDWWNRRLATASSARTRVPRLAPKLYPNPQKLCSCLLTKTWPHICSRWQICLDQHSNPYLIWIAFLTVSRHAFQLVP